ncbi:MAG TPA: sialidase family protein, partial [Ktedonobacterales bacterium]|nr:sialidase family protein [Ktedonobacterales bacterium]
LLMPTVSTQAHVGVAGATGADVFASADGGATWTHPILSGTASTSSIPGDGMTTLSDGSLAVVLDDAPLAELYRWKLGGAPWTAIASTDNVTSPVSLVNIPAQGHDVLWLMVGVGSNPATATYSVYTDTP